MVIALVLGLAATAWGISVGVLTSRNAAACGDAAGSAEAGTDRELQRVLAAYSHSHEGVGLQVSVVLPDGSERRAVAGFADHRRECEMTLQHHVFVGSITKLYTAVLVLRLVDQGAVELDEPVGSLVGLPLPPGVTVETLLNHTSGIPSYTENPWFLARFFGLPNKSWEPTELLDSIDVESPRFAPGERHEYSNSNFVLLGVVVEAVTGRSYGDALQELLQDGPALDHTFYGDYPTGTEIANGYDVSVLGLGQRNLTGFRTSFETGGYAAGGILSTAGDVAAFLDALFGGNLLTPETLQEMHGFVDAPDQDVPEQVGYGLGLRRLRIEGEELVGHSGTIPGYSGIALHNPRHNLTVAILSNQSTIDQADLVAEVQAVVLEQLEQPNP